MFEPMPWTPHTGLKHLAFFEVLAANEDGSPVAVAATAGLLALRMLDHRALAGPAITAPESMSVRSVRKAAVALGADDPLRRAVLSFVNRMQQTDLAGAADAGVDLQAMATAYRAMGLETLAVDVELTVARYTTWRAEAALKLLAWARKREERDRPA